MTSQKFGNLVDDLMEPFRPIIDELAYKENPQKFETDEKRKLQNILNLKYRINENNHYLSEVIKIYTKSIFDALNSNDLSLVRFFTDEL